MLTDYENKVSSPNTKDTNICPSCKGKDWKQVIRKMQKYLICKRCGHAKKVSK